MYFMEMTFLPKTSAGKWSISLFIAFIALAAAGSMISSLQENTIEYPNFLKSDTKRNIKIKEWRGMALAIALVIASIIGIIYGIINKNKPLGIISVIVLVMIIAVWVYFYNNPY